MLIWFYLWSRSLVAAGCEPFLVALAHIVLVDHTYENSHSCGLRIKVSIKSMCCSFNKQGAYLRHGARPIDHQHTIAVPSSVRYN